MGNWLILKGLIEKQEKRDDIYEHCKFKDRFFDEVLPTLTSEVVQIITSKEWVRFNVTLQWVKVFLHLEKTECKSFIPYCCQQIPTSSDKILSHISHISFTSLIKLDLSNNQITSIEPIASLNMENIKQVFLHSNCIMNIGTLYKTKWNQLQKLLLHGNCLLQIDISRVLANGLTYFYVNHFPEQQTQIEDPRILAKIQSRLIGVITLSINQEMIYNKKVYTAIKNIYKYAFINWGHAKIAR